MQRPEPFSRLHHVLIVPLLGLILCLSGCGAGKTLVMEPFETRLLVHSVNITQGKSTVNVPNEVSQELMEKLSQKLYVQGKFAQGPELTITCRFLQYNPGNQLTRWFLGGIGNSGEGTMTVEASYADASGKQLGKIQSEGKIGSGFFGGGFSLAIDKAADEIAEYTIANFK